MKASLTQVLADTRSELPDHTVYALVDPRAPRVARYIGLTVDLERRLAEHLKKRRSGRLEVWFDELRAVGLAPVARIVMSGLTYQLARKVEWLTIRTHRKAGVPLLNALTPLPAIMVDDVHGSEEYKQLRTFEERLEAHVA